MYLRHRLLCLSTSPICSRASRPSPWRTIGHTPLAIMGHPNGANAFPLVPKVSAADRTIMQSLHILTKIHPPPTTRPAIPPGPPPHPARHLILRATLPSLPLDSASCPTLPPTPPSRDSLPPYPAGLPSLTPLPSSSATKASLAL